MKTFVIAQLPTGAAAHLFTGPDWLAQARRHWPDATSLRGEPLCDVCGRGPHAHGGTHVVKWCGEP